MLDDKAEEFLKSYEKHMYSMMRSYYSLTGFFAAGFNGALRDVDLLSFSQRERLQRYFQAKGVSPVELLVSNKLLQEFDTAKIRYILEYGPLPEASTSISKFDIQEEP